MIEPVCQFQAFEFGERIEAAEQVPGLGSLGMRRALGCRGVLLDALVVLLDLPPFVVDARSSARSLRWCRWSPE